MLELQRQIHAPVRVGDTVGGGVGHRRSHVVKQGRATVTSMISISSPPDGKAMTYMAERLLARWTVKWQ